MARDLSFWKKKNNIQIKNSDIYKDLSNGKYLDYICEIPSEEILQDIAYGFSEWRRLNNYCFANGVINCKRLLNQNKYKRATA